MWTDRQRQAYHRQYDRWLTQQDRKAVRIVLVNMGQLLSSLRTALVSSNAEGALALLDMLVPESIHGRILEQIYTNTGVVAAEREYNRLIPPAKADPLQIQLKDRDVPELPQAPRPSGLIRINHNSETWRQRMVAMAQSSETASRIKLMTDKTRQLVREVLTTGASERWTLPKLVRGLRGVVVDKVRATLIARTETTRAANAGAREGGLSTLLKLNKIWIATADGRTRQDHATMLGSKPVPFDGHFIVGGVKMLYPGDPAGGAAQCCRCRCAHANVPATNFFD